MLGLSYDMLNQQYLGTARSVPDPSSPRGEWGQTNTKIKIKSTSKSEKFPDIGIPWDRNSKSNNWVCYKYRTMLEQDD